MDGKFMLSNSKAKALTLILTIAIFSMLASCATYSVKESGQSADMPPFIKRFIAQHVNLIGESKQLIFGTSRDAVSVLITIHTLEKGIGSWHAVFPPFAASIGEGGFAAIDKKKEGDGKSPSGIFPLGIAFGYNPSVVTMLPYRQVMDDDFWVDDVDSENYNKWVKGKPNAASFEKMKRDDDQYKFGVVIEYNMRPIVKGKGSAVFLHVWKGGSPTVGCVAVPEEMILKILAWLNPLKKPMIIMGIETELLAVNP
jgi:L,D-peptidoglycan transpeptidase YkuD (ErfK/YbiS/YcfS/YnhG family)